MRNKTERTQGLDEGVSKLIGTDPRVIIEEVSNLLEGDSAYESMIKSISPYGDGLASKRIANILVEQSNLKP